MEASVLVILTDNDRSKEALELRDIEAQSFLNLLQAVRTRSHAIMLSAYSLRVATQCH